MKVPGFCAGEDLAFLETELEEFIQSRLDSLPPEHVFYEDKSRKDSLKQIQQLHQYSALFHQWMTNRPQVLAEALLGEPVRAMNLQYFNKAPGMSRPTPPHQDKHVPSDYWRAEGRDLIEEDCVLIASRLRGCGDEVFAARDYWRTMR